MSFLAKHWLWLFVPLVALVVLYVVLALRRRTYAARFASAPLLATVMPRRPQWWRRHVPAALMLLTLATAIVAVARPARDERVPRERATIMLAIDVSNSMAATDVAPTRLEAAKDGASAFVDQLPPKINLGLVEFSGAAAVLVAPTTDRAAVRNGISALQLGPATAIGEGIFASLQAIASASAQLSASGQAPPPAAIVLLSDGETTRGRPNSQATDASRAAKIPVDTIAYGTPNGTLDIGGQQIPVPVNTDALKQIADATGGTYHRATSGDELKSVYSDLGSSVGYLTQHREVTTWFVGLAVLLGFAAAATSMLFAAGLP